MANTPPPKHDHTTLTFPEGFLWGAATSAYQVEGNCTHSDWWEWGVLGKIPPQGQACDQYHRFKEDFDLIKSLGHNAHRLGIEWSRIEPEDGRFDENEIEHYRTVLKTLKEKGVTVMLTLHHFSNPLWFSKKGGWESFKAPYYFERFVKKIVPEIKDLVDLWITINEPGVLMWGGYLSGKWPPQKKSNLAALKVFLNLIRAHKKAYKAIHKIKPSARVGIAHNVASFDVFHDHSLRENLLKVYYDKVLNHSFYTFTGMKYHDFLGINYYFHHYISLSGKTRLPSPIDVSVVKKDVTDMGWEIHPDGIFDVLVDLSDYKKPIYITENGLASTNDDRRARFLIAYLKEIYHAIAMGADVRGYFHWSLIDNYEWADGFGPRFGLIEIDYNTLKRTPRPSGFLYKDIIKNNGIRHELLKFLGHRVNVEDVIKIP